MDVTKIKEDIENQINRIKDNYVEYKIEGQQIIGARERQEDTFICLPTKDNIFACLADGIGGLDRGDMASAISCQYLLKQRFINSFEHQFLIDGFQLADREVCRFANENQLNGSGCTLIGIWIIENQFYFCSIGDSLLYLYRQGKLQQLNRRHNYKLYLDDLLLNDQISNHDYQRNLNKKDVVISYIGKGNISLIDYNKEAICLKKDDVILMCSDGVTGTVSPDEIQKIISKNQNPSTINTSIINLIKIRKKPTQDNASIITILKMKE